MCFVDSTPDLTDWHCSKCQKAEMYKTPIQTYAFLAIMEVSCFFFQLLVRFGIFSGFSLSKKAKEL
jgi:hypothetical protein